MKKEEIIKILNYAINEPEEEKGLQTINKLIEDLKNEIITEEYKKGYKKADVKKRLAAIKRILTDKKSACRPVLQTVGLKTVDLEFVTDSYHAIILKNEGVLLPFKHNFTSNCEIPEEKRKEIETTGATYPDLTNFFNKDFTSYETTEVKALDVLNFIKINNITKSNAAEKLFYIKNITINVLYLKNIIDILQLGDTFTVYYTDDRSPLYIKNERDEVGLILPIKKY